MASIECTPVREKTIHSILKRKILNIFYQLQCKYTSYSHYIIVLHWSSKNQTYTTYMYCILHNFYFLKIKFFQYKPTITKCYKTSKIIPSFFAALNEFNKHLFPRIKAKYLQNNSPAWPLLANWMHRRCTSSNEDYILNFPCIPSSTLEFSR